jgi:exopolyphosphatase/guanosine-5'-triphosphate,3'-diphosphate pyrophosphatase
MQSNYSEVYSVIDLGTNTCLLLIAKYSENRVTKLFEAQEIPRLGKGLYETGKISLDSFRKTSDIFSKYISISKEHNSEKVFAFGTSAMREAKNSKEFIDFIKKETGIEIKVISGKDEAKYGFDGALFDMPDENYTVLDIGGGSTEFSYMENVKLITESFRIGSVRLNEIYFKENFSNENIQKAKEFVRESFKTVELKNQNERKLVGVAGTLTTLSAIKNKLNNFEEEIIHKDELNLTEIENIFQRLIILTNEERLKIGEFMKGRSEIIISGALILIEIMKRFEFKTVTVSTKGLRYGLLMNIADFKN